MADGMGNKSSMGRLWGVLLVVIVLILLWLWKSGGMPTVSDTEKGPDGDSGPKVQICINNGGTWNTKTHECDIAAEPTDEVEGGVVGTGEDEELIATGAENDDAEIEANLSGEVVLGG